MKQILEMTEKMLDAAKNKDWDTLDSLEHGRAARLEDLDVHPIDECLPEWMDNLQALYEKNRELLQLTQIEAQHLKSEIQLLRLSKQANALYQKHANG